MRMISSCAICACLEVMLTEGSLTRAAIRLEHDAAVAQQGIGASSRAFRRSAPRPRRPDHASDAQGYRDADADSRIAWRGERHRKCRQRPFRSGVLQPQIQAHRQRRRHGAVFARLDRAPGCQRRKAEAGSHTAGLSQLRSQAGQWRSRPRARRLRQGASRPASPAALCGRLPQRGAPRPSEETASGTDRRISCRRSTSSSPLRKPDTPRIGWRRTSSRARSRRTTCCCACRASLPPHWSRPKPMASRHYPPTWRCRSRTGYSSQHFSRP